MEADLVKQIHEATDDLMSHANDKRITVHDYNGKDVKAIRQGLSRELHHHVSQRIFALLMGVSIKTVQSWEIGNSNPSPTACRLLYEIKAHPKAVIWAVFKDTRFWK